MLRRSLLWRLAKPQLASQGKGQVDGNQGNYQKESSVGGGHALLVRTIAIEGDEAVDQHQQQDGLRRHFTTPASGLDAVA